MGVQKSQKWERGHTETRVLPARGKRPENRFGHLLNSSYPGGGGWVVINFINYGDDVTQA
jgi:hypothetical protein